MVNLKEGTKVIITHPFNVFDINVGIILQSGNNAYTILTLTSKYEVLKNIPERDVYIAEKPQIDLIRQKATNEAQFRIEQLKSNLMDITQEEKNIYKIDKYNQIKEQIVNTAKNLVKSVEDIDNDEFENKVIALSQLKKALYSIKLEKANEIRENNRINNHHIHSWERNLERFLDKFTYEYVENAFSWANKTQTIPKEPKTLKCCKVKPVEKNY